MADASKIPINLTDIERVGASIILKAIVGPASATKVLSEIDNVTYDVNEAAEDVIAISSREVTKVIRYVDVPVGDRLGTTTADQFARYLGLNLNEFSSIQPEDQLYCQLNKVGSPLVFNAAVKGDVTPVEFECLAGTDMLVIQKIALYMEGNTPFMSDDFGSGDALPVGLDFQINEISKTILKTNIDVIMQSGASSQPFEVGASKQMSADVIWSPGLVVNKGSRLHIVVGDDLTSRLNALFIGITAIRIPETI